jgi:uncharacterized membrane protein (UPF0127 family)
MPDSNASESRNDFESMQSMNIEIIRSDGRSLQIDVKVADSPKTQALGFQFADTESIYDNVILFVFEKESIGLFHMENVVAPLDIAFIDPSGAFVEILTMEPGTKQYGVNQPILFAIEARRGYFSGLNIQAGRAKLELNP